MKFIQFLETNITVSYLAEYSYERTDVCITTILLYYISVHKC